MATFSISNIFKSLTDPFAKLAKSNTLPITSKPQTSTLPASMYIPTPSQQSSSSIQSSSQNYPAIPATKSPNANTTTWQGKPAYFGGTPAIPQVKNTTTANNATTPSLPAIPTIPTDNTEGGTKIDTGSTSGAPRATATPTIDPLYQKAVDEAETAYKKSLEVSADELATQEDLDKLTESARKGYLNASNQAIPMEFITGQLSAIEKRATNLAEPLETKLARLQAARTASLEASKFALDRADKELAAEKSKYGYTAPVSVSPGSTLVDPKTGKAIYTAPSATENKAPTTMETSAGIMQWNPDTKKWESTGYSKPSSETAIKNAQEKSDAEIAKKNQAGETISLVNNLLASGKTGSITGVGQNLFNALGVSNATLLNQYKTLKSKLAIGARQLIKGQGQVSDYEAKTLADSASTLGRNLSNAEFDKELKRIRGVLKTNTGLTTPVTITNPNTGEKITAELGGDEIYALIVEGNTVEYQ